MNISARLLDNIPDEVPTVLRPHALKNPMLDRLRTLLRDAELRASTQHAITPTGSPGKATSTRAVELAVLLQRAHEHFLPIEGDATNALRRDAWHGPVSSVQAEAAHSFEYTWFRRVGTVLQDTISNSLASPVMLQKHRESVRCARDTAARSVYSSAWSEV